MRTGKYQQKNEKKVFKHAERLNDKIIMWGEMKITEEKIKWNVQVFKVFALGWMIIFKTYSYKTLSQPTLVWYIWICSKSKQNQKTMMKNMTKLVYQEKKIQSMLSEPRTAISLMYIAASSLWRSTIIAVEQAWNYIVRPSVTSVTTAEFYRRSHPEQSSRSNEFCRRSFIKYTPWSVCFLIVMLIKKNKTKKKTCVFSWATIWPVFSEHFAFRFYFKTWKHQSKRVDFDLLNHFSLWTISDLEIWCFFNFNALTLNWQL